MRRSPGSLCSTFRRTSRRTVSWHTPNPIALLLVFLLVRHGSGFLAFGFTVPQRRDFRSGLLLDLPLAFAVVWLSRLFPSKSPFDVSCFSISFLRPAARNRRNPAGMRVFASTQPDRSNTFHLQPLASGARILRRQSDWPHFHPLRADCWFLPAKKGIIQQRSSHDKHPGSNSGASIR
jgi:hypothetical protein